MLGKKDWRSFRLYVITGENYHPGRSLTDVMEETLRGGADIVQLRDKNASKADLLEKAKQLRELTARYGVPLIINDHPDIAIAVGADGVHLGQDDMPLAEARRLLGPERIIGISTHNIGQARLAQAEGADYIGVGPVFPTGTKPGRTPVTLSYVSEAAAEIRIPFVAIGGITPDNVDSVLEAGARRICAVSAIVGNADPAGVCRRLLERISRYEAARESSGPAKSCEVTVNGRSVLTDAGTVAELVAQYGLLDRKLVVEWNGAVLARHEWEKTPLENGAVIELVHFVGGG
ncbi:thiamine phosphate synthase [Paenibacillus cisolokensis]|jgi:thiamine-phosphate pyrophosphorylase|uniref:thiamine phosphate synthase n=1 Tax=Paenibacillus cisolokensis TaxID=1658519 RepID=UPI003D2A1AB1